MRTRFSLPLPEGWTCAILGLLIAIGFAAAPVLGLVYVCCKWLTGGGW